MYKKMDVNIIIYLCVSKHFVYFFEKQKPNNISLIFYTNNINYIGT